jgi:hypothetical protein
MAGRKERRRTRSSVGRLDIVVFLLRPGAVLVVVVITKAESRCGFSATACRHRDLNLYQSP